MRSTFKYKEDERQFQPKVSHIDLKRCGQPEETIAHFSFDLVEYFERDGDVVAARALEAGQLAVGQRGAPGVRLRHAREQSTQLLRTCRHRGPTEHSNSYPHAIGHWTAASSQASWVMRLRQRRA